MKLLFSSASKLNNVHLEEAWSSCSLLQFFVVRCLRSKEKLGKLVYLFSRLDIISLECLIGTLVRSQINGFRQTIFDVDFHSLLFKICRQIQIPSILALYYCSPLMWPFRLFHCNCYYIITATANSKLEIKVYRFTII
jgi:hypothetical protein